MSDQLILFSEPRARHDNPVTSYEAAALVKPEALERCVVETLRMYQRVWGEGATDEQIVKHLKYDPEGSVVTARGRLKNLGVVVDSGEKRTNSRGRQMIVWRLT